MEGESGLGSPSETVRLLTFAELADELCPQYMSIGVPYREYWYGDYTQLEYYARAFEFQRERMNYGAWLQGAYIYDALCMVQPILHANAKRGARPVPYHKEPYGVNGGETGATDKPTKTAEEIQAIQATNASAKFSSFATQWNRRFESEGGETNGGND